MSGRRRVAPRGRMPVAGAVALRDEHPLREALCQVLVRLHRVRRQIELQRVARIAAADLIVLAAPGNGRRNKAWGRRLLSRAQERDQRVCVRWREALRMSAAHERCA